MVVAVNLWEVVPGIIGGAVAFGGGFILIWNHVKLRRIERLVEEEVGEHESE